MNSTRHEAKRWSTPLIILTALAALTAQHAVAGPPQEAEELWRKSWFRLMDAERESNEAMDVQIKAVNSLFEQAKAKTRPFVTDILGLEGKLKYAAGGTEQAVNFIAGALDSVFGSNMSHSNDHDSFALFARERFRRHVFDDAAFKRELETAAAAYVARLQEIDGRLLVDLQADLPDDTWIPTRAIPSMKLEDMLLLQVDAVIRDVIADATTDFAVNAAKETVSWVGGDILAASVMAGSAGAAAQADDPWTVGGIAVTLAAGWAVDQAVGGVMNAMGHDPVGQLTAKVQTRLDQARDLVIHGLANNANDYRILTLYCISHPDFAMRTLCGEAAITMEKHTGLGLRSMLEAQHFKRSLTRRVDIYRALFGSEVQLPPSLFIEPSKALSDDEVLRIARKRSTIYRGLRHGGVK